MCHTGQQSYTSSSNPIPPAKKTQMNYMNTTMRRRENDRHRKCPGGERTVVLFGVQRETQKERVCTQPPSFFVRVTEVPSASHTAPPLQRSRTPRLKCICQQATPPSLPLLDLHSPSLDPLAFTPYGHIHLDAIHALGLLHKRMSTHTPALALFSGTSSSIGSKNSPVRLASSTEKWYFSLSTSGSAQCRRRWMLRSSPLRLKIS